MPPADLYHEIAGQGDPVVLLHPGLADSRIFDPQWPKYSERFRTERLDMPGFGRSPIRSVPVTYASDVAELLTDVNLGPAAVVGLSLGGRVALELAIARPHLVSALVLAGSGLPEALAASPEVALHTSALIEAIGRRDLHAAVELTIRTWVDGPRRSPEGVEGSIRKKVAVMQHDAYLNSRAFMSTWREERAQADAITDAIPDAHLETIAGTAHVPIQADLFADPACS